METNKEAIEGYIVPETVVVSEDLILYAVRNKKGQYFHNVGYGGYGRSWVNTLQEARIYGKIGPAKRQVTYWGSHYPEYGIPELLKITMGKIEIIDQNERVSKFKVKKAREEAAQKKRDAEEKILDAKREIARLNREMEKAEQEIRVNAITGRDFGNFRNKSLRFTPDGHLAYD
jgi:hypothetical protein